MYFPLHLIKYCRKSSKGKRRLWNLHILGNFFFALYLNDCVYVNWVISAIEIHPFLRFYTFCITVDGNTWAQVIALYPTLVECITCSSSEVCSALKEALVPFKDFMQPPASKVQNGES